MEWRGKGGAWRLMQAALAHVFTHDSIGSGEDGLTAPAGGTDRHAAPDPEHGCMASVRHGGNTGGMGRAASSATTGLTEPDPQPPETCRLLPATPNNNNIAMRLPAALRDSNRQTDPCCLLATGSEIDLALKAQAQLAEQGIGTRGTLPSTNVFDRQDAAHRATYAAKGVARAPSAGVGLLAQICRPEGGVIGIDRFGESAPASELFHEFGFTH